MAVKKDSLNNELFNKPVTELISGKREGDT